MKRLWVAVALAPLSFAAATADRAHAQNTSITGATSTPLQTSTSGNITVGGSIVPDVGPGAAITVNSDASVTVAGTVGYSGISGNATTPSSAILVDAGTTTPANAATNLISSSGTIENTETTTGDTTVSQTGIVTGPFANGSNRFGIDVVGPGVFNGAITTAGTITIIGENSAAIAIGTEMTGALTASGTISVVGGSYGATPGAGTNLDVSYGINATGKIDGNVNIAGTVSATGQNAVGVALGEVDGSSGVAVAGSITATGYRSTTAPTDPTVLAKVTPDQLLQGGPALEVGGNIANGLNISLGVAASGNIEAVTQGSLSVFGSAPAMLIGGNSPITIGVGAPLYSVEIGGSVTASGTYADHSATGIQIGGVNPLPVATSSGVASGAAFGAVTISSGMDVDGTVVASSEEHTEGKADATGILFGAGAVVGPGPAPNSADLVIEPTGNITVVAESDALISTTTANEISVTGKPVPITASGVTIAPGASVSSIDNQGLINVAVGGIPVAINYTAAGGVQGQAIAINDQAGTLTSVTNSGDIFASVTPIVVGQVVDPLHSDAIALYLGNVGNNVTLTQNLVGNQTIVPTISGEVIFGNTTVAAATPKAITGAETLNLDTGFLLGNVEFNGSGANSLEISGGAALTGGLSQSTTGTLDLNIQNGVLNMTAPTSNLIGSGTTASIKSQSLIVGANGAIVFDIDPRELYPTTGQFNVSGTAEFDTGSKIGVALASKLTQTETFTLVHAGALSLGSGNVSAIDSALLGQLPYLYQGAITTTATDVDVKISTKSAAELGMNPAQTSAYNAVYSQMSTDQQVENDVLAQTTRSGFFHVYNQFLPDYSGGQFETVAVGQRALAEAEETAPTKLLSNETRGWVQEIGFLANRDSSALANGYQGTGYGLAGGIERASGDSAIGVAAAFISSGLNDATQSSDASLSTEVIEGGVYWRTGGGGFNVAANVNGGYVALGSHRLMVDQTAAGAVTLLRDAESQWSGAVASAQFGASYQINFGRFFMRPEASADYIGLYESSHDEQGGGPALDLALNSRTSTEASAQADVVFGWTFGTGMQWRPEMTLGWRQIVTGGPAATTARFLSGGQSFTLAPDLSDRGGLLARLGLRASGSFADITADAGGEFRNGYQSYDARAIARFLF